MRDPNNLKPVLSNGDEINFITLDTVPDYDIEDYNLLDEKDFKKYMDDIEREVRLSFEYKRMIGFLRNKFGMNTCSFYENVTNENNYGIKIEIHHEPFSLFDICGIVYRKRCTYRESLSVSMVAKEVMFLHFSLLVGLIPLAVTPHQLVHNQYLFVPTTRVMGKYRDFMNMYEEFILPEHFDMMERIEALTEVYKDAKPDVLARNYIYIDFGEELPKYDDVLKLMQKRIDELKFEENLVKPMVKGYVALDRPMIKIQQ